MDFVLLCRDRKTFLHFDVEQTTSLCKMREGRKAVKQGQISW